MILVTKLTVIKYGTWKQSPPFQQSLHNPKAFLQRLFHAFNDCECDMMILNNGLRLLLLLTWHHLEFSPRNLPLHAWIKGNPP